MPDYHLLVELLGLPNVRVTHYQLVGAERIRFASSLSRHLPPRFVPNVSRSA